MSLTEQLLALKKACDAYQDADTPAEIVAFANDAANKHIPLLFIALVLQGAELAALRKSMSFADHVRATLADLREGTTMTVSGKVMVDGMPSGVVAEMEREKREMDARAGARENMRAIRLCRQAQAFEVDGDTLAINPTNLPTGEKTFTNATLDDLAREANPPPLPSFLARTKTVEEILREQGESEAESFAQAIEFLAKKGYAVVPVGAPRALHPHASKIPVAYIAGPYSAVDALTVEKNVRAAEAAAYEVYRLGGAPICPHTTTRYVDSQVPYEVMVEATMETMLRCDVVLAIEGWQTSKGAKGEVAKAAALGIPVVFNLKQLREWVERREKTA